jgi:hypothetical protein
LSFLLYKKAVFVILNSFSIKAIRFWGCGAKIISGLKIRLTTRELTSNILLQRLGQKFYIWATKNFIFGQQEVIDNCGKSMEESVYSRILCPPNYPNPNIMRISEIEFTSFSD